MIYFMGLSGGHGLDQAHSTHLTWAKPNKAESPTA